MWIKICGLNDPAIAREIVSLRPDAIGLNFYERSVRVVTAAAARQIAEELPATIEAIGIFVDASGEQMRQTAASYGLRGIQIHSPADSDSLDDFAVEQPASNAPPKRIRAFQIGSRGLAPVAAYFQRHQARSVAVDAYLLDAHVDGLHGGTGKTVSWDLLRNEYQTEKWPPLILAGGLRPENVAEAIETVRPWGVDVASGVESSPGIKDVTLVARFIEEARRAFAGLGRETKARLGTPE